jgi:nitrate reductase molybdenum cofactor assembly chaperone
MERTGTRHSGFSHYADLARLFTYPEEGAVEALTDIQNMLDARYPEAARLLRPFTEFAATSPLWRLQELFVRTFDVQAITTLDVGYVLFGEDYKRGVLLVHLNQEHRQAGVDCGRELPDHLPNVLTLIARTRREDIRKELVEKLLAPALRQMIAEFDPGTVASKNELHRKKDKTLLEVPAPSGTLYRHALEALYEVLRSDFGFEEARFGRIPAAAAEFLGASRTDVPADPEES